MSVNKVILVGFVGADPEIKQTNNRTSVARIRLATSESYKNKSGERVNNTEWHTVILWDKLANVVEQYVKKGNQIYIEGKINTREWEDKNGNKRHSTEVVAGNMTMLGKQNDSNPNTLSQKQSQPIQPVNVDDDLPF